MSAFLLLALALAPGTAMPQKDNYALPEVASRLGLTGLIDAMTKTGLISAFRNAGPFTVFGPTNKAFENLPGAVKGANKDVNVLADFVKYHSLYGKILFKDLQNELVVDTVNGQKVQINLYTVANKKVATAQCAPIDLTRVDQVAFNGVVHVLNTGMKQPPGNLLVALNQSVANMSLQSLVKAIRVAGLVDTFSGPAPFTLFAPTDEAFRKLPPGTHEKLSKDFQMLADIIRYHVMPGTFCGAGLSTGNLKTVQGQEISIILSKHDVMVNSAKVISTDLSATNGVVHVIDTVLLPPSFSFT